MQRIADNSPSVCDICGNQAFLCGVVDFNKSCLAQAGTILPLAGIPVYYRACRTCGFLSCDSFRHWGPAEFKAHIYNEDYAQVDPDYAEARPQVNFAVTDYCFAKFKEKVSILDYGGGNGLCAEKLRAAGYSAQSYDPFVETDVAPAARFDIVTAFEVVEHANDQNRLVEDMARWLKEEGVILFSTHPQPEDFDPFKTMSWWYVGPRNGHVSIHTPRSLSKLFEKFGFSLVSLNKVLHAAYRGTPAFAAHLINPAGLARGAGGAAA